MEKSTISPALEVRSIESAERIEAKIKSRLGGRVWKLHVSIQEQGLVLQGIAHTYYAKQLAQHVAMNVTGLPIAANEIEVRCE